MSEIQEEQRIQTHLRGLVQRRNLLAEKFALKIVGAISDLPEDHSATEVAEDAYKLADALMKHGGNPPIEDLKKLIPERE